jgi:hypothetical protein
VGTLVALILLFLNRRSLFMSIASIVSANLACFLGYQFLYPYFEGVRLKELYMNLLMFIFIPIGVYLLSFSIYLLVKKIKGGVQNIKEKNKE